MRVNSRGQPTVMGVATAILVVFPSCFTVLADHVGPHVVVNRTESRLGRPEKIRRVTSGNARLFLVKSVGGQLSLYRSNISQR